MEAPQAYRWIVATPRPTLPPVHRCASPVPDRSQPEGRSAAERVNTSRYGAKSAPAACRWQADCCARAQVPTSTKLSQPLLCMALAIPLLSAGIASGADSAGPPERLRGMVVDAGGRPVCGARISAPGLRGDPVAVSDERGRFELPEPAALPVEIRVTAAGYMEKAIALTASDPARVVLTPIGFADEVTVTAARSPERVRDTPASVVSVSSADLELAPQTAVDAVLRQVPGFTLFRRSDSRTANPTTQGPSLRGVGGSGASRALVLDDGVPLNDPFGGWVSWGRIVESGVDRVEIVRGGSSDRYGAPALSGVIQLVPRDPAASAVSAEASYGSESTGDVQAFASATSGPWSGRVAAEGFRTGGFVVVAPAEAGIVDVPANSRRASADATVERQDEAVRLLVRGGYFDDDRGNGTPLQVNDTRLWQISAGADGTPAASQTYSGHVYGVRRRITRPSLRSVRIARPRR